MIMNNSPILPNFNESVMDLDTKVLGIFGKIREMLEKFPEIDVAINYDLDNAGLDDKKMRLAKRAYEERLEMERGGFLFDPSACDSPDNDLTLKSGRPRMPAPMVFFFLTLRGLWGSVTDQEAVERFKDSISVQATLSHFGFSTPGVSTIRENVNKVSNETRHLILSCQARHILEEGLDDFNEVYIDSTHVAANTAFPTEISILHKLLDRALREISLLREFGLPVKIESWTETRLAKMLKHLKFVNMSVGRRGLKGKVKEQFRAFLNLAVKVIGDLEVARDALTPFWETIDISPEKALALDVLWDKVEQDLGDASYVLHYADLQTKTGEPLPAAEKILSVVDRDAGYISKGQRVPVIGYRPHIARSGNGFVVGHVTPRGNASDAGMLIPVVENVIETTGVVPYVVSVDDGYASIENKTRLIDEFGVVQVSVSGAKGKKITEDDLWDAPDFVAARAQRSAVESGMFTLKFNHGYGRVRRRGIDAVHAEQTEKIIAYNFTHMIRKARENQKRLEEEERRRILPNAA